MERRRSGSAGMSPARSLVIAAAYGIVVGGVIGLIIDPPWDNVASSMGLLFAAMLLVLSLARYVARHPR